MYLSEKHHRYLKVFLTELEKREWRRMQ